MGFWWNLYRYDKWPSTLTKEVCTFGHSRNLSKVTNIEKFTEETWVNRYLCTTMSKTGMNLTQTLEK